MIGVLGPVVVTGEDGAPVPLRSWRPRVLLAVLVARRGRVVTADELVEVLWGDELPAHPLAALQSQVHRLRRQLGPIGEALRVDGLGYRLDCGPEQVDATRFESLVERARARTSDPELAVTDLDEALGLWRGRAYMDAAEQDAVRAEAVRLEELRADASEERAELLLALGRVADAGSTMELLAVEHPYRERPIALRMRALAAAGRHVDALRVFDAFRRRIGDDLGLEPSPELRTLDGEILRHETPPRATIGLPGNSFVGREVDLAEVTRQLERARLVTLTGPGGVGKTRLAAHVAARVGNAYPDGVYLCELAALGDPAGVTGVVGSTLQVQQRGGRTLLERIVEFLQTKRALLVLDNCEHVLAGVRELSHAILTRTPDVVVLATGRQRLGVEGEHVFAVGPLPVPHDDDIAGPAVALFIDRAAAVRPDPELTDDDVAAVRELSRRLDGIPLAIELAAARTVSRTPVEILAEIGDRTDRLADARRSVDRHRSIDAVVTWSYDMLTPYERAALRRVSVFAGGCTAAAAAAVIGDDTTNVVDTLTSLAEHSLVTVAQAAGHTRFSMLEPVRQYAEARLGDECALDASRARHAVWVADLMDTADAGLRGPEEARWVAAIDAELANVRAAHQWCLEHDPDRALRIVAALYWYAYWYGTTEVFTWADRTVDRCAERADALMVRACATSALGAWRRGDLVGARTLAERAIRLAPANDPAAARFAWETLRSTDLLAGNYERSLESRDHALALARAVGDTAHEAHALTAGALALGYLGRIDEARAELAAADSLLGTSAPPTVRAFCDYVAGEVRVDTAPADALPLLERSRDTARQIGNRFLAGIAGVSAVSCSARVGDPAQALGGYSELIDHFDRAGAWPQQWTTIRTLIETLTRLRCDEPAATLHGALTASPTAPRIIGADATRIAAALTELRQRLGEEPFMRRQAEGAALGDQRAVAYALHCTRADVAGSVRAVQPVPHVV